MVDLVSRNRLTVLGVTLEPPKAAGGEFIDGSLAS